MFRQPTFSPTASAQGPDHQEDSEQGPFLQGEGVRHSSER